MSARRLMRFLLARALSDQRGATILEGVVAALVLTMGALGVLRVFDAGARNTRRAEQSQVVNDKLQSELEEIRQIPYAQVALTSLPTTVGDSNNPRHRVSGSRYATSRDGTGLK